MDCAAATDVARDLFGIDGTVTQLASERDLNFRVTTGDASYALKVANSGETAGCLDFQTALLEHLAGIEYAVPTVIHALDGRAIVETETASGTHLVRLLGWVPGSPMAQMRPVDGEHRRQLGHLAGCLSEALASFEHPAAHRELKWDLCNAAETITANLELIENAAQRDLLKRLLDRYTRWTAPRLADLRRGVIYNDLNDHNVLVSGFEETSIGPRCGLAGIIDVGDALEGWVVTDLAVAVSYALLNRANHLAVLREVTGGYHSRFALQECEAEVVLELAVLRLMLSVANSAEQARDEPDNSYLQVSEAPAWDALARLEHIHPDLGAAHARSACNMEPCPAGGLLRRWLAAEPCPFAPIVDEDLANDSVHVFDLGVGSGEMGAGAPGDFETEALSDLLFGHMHDRNARFGLGRWDEVRSWYGGELFAAPSNEAPRRRTVHVGIDVFADAGTPLYAPLAGTVVSAHVNEGRLDYGPTLILEHQPTPEVKFWSLFGHLTEKSISDSPVGTKVAAGDRIAAIGDYPINGDWPPHLHFQLIADRLDYAHDYPGVCDPEERAVWTSLSPDPGRVLGLGTAQMAPVGPDPDAVTAARGRHIGRSLSVSYRRPLTILRGFRQYLYDVDGQPFLDAVNNVPHVGHQHPHVVAAAAAQNAVLNTNTRYLHHNITRYAERLVATLPDPLNVCYFVCSGSEANELALRIARTATGRRDVVALDGAYHGNTSTLIDISPYKHDGPGGAGAPDWVHIAKIPDPYRGEFAGEENAAQQYADDVRRCMVAAETNGGAAAFIAEPLLGCGGQIVPPAGYLPAAFDHVRAAGGICIADEVQVGFGRAGSHFWAFQTQDVVPDIVTLGKPIGNGFPLAAVVTTAELAQAFDNGMEYFNTFGGNPVSCAVGAAVLDVIETEGLQANAHAVGRQLLNELGEIAGRHRIVGHVRGLGLYLGAELVRDPDTRAPAADAASYVVNRLRDHGILISTDGPDHNVLKLKPPMCFGAADADRFLETLDAVLAEDFIHVTS